MRRLECLDGVRGLLAVYVMLSHMAPFAALPDWLTQTLSHGGAAVDMFFILSGLVITRSLASFDWQPRPFLIARATRIFPTYLPVLALAVLVQPIPADFAALPWIGPDSQARGIWAQGWPADWGAELAAHLTMTHGLFPAGVLPNVWVSFLGAAWSLSTEWQFYVLVLFTGGWLRSDRRDPLPLLALGFLALATAGAAWQAAAPAPWQFSRAFLPLKAHYFALGIASAALLQGQSRLYAPILGAVLGLIAAQGGWDKLLVPLAWTLCLGAERRPAAPGLRMVGHILRCPPMLWCGAISYPLYLVNEPIQKLLGFLLGRIAAGEAALFTLLWIPLALVLPLWAAAWLHAHVEAPAMRWGHALARSLRTGSTRRMLEAEG
ncbi:MAG: acyltransferase [Rhodospirillales bacterium]|nr:acyltransferase [Rhodospirillales bacterium]